MIKDVLKTLGLKAENENNEEVEIKLVNSDQYGRIFSLLDDNYEEIASQTITSSGIESSFSGDNCTIKLVADLDEDVYTLKITEDKDAE